MPEVGQHLRAQDHSQKQGELATTYPPSQWMAGDTRPKKVD